VGPGGRPLSIGLNKKTSSGAVDPVKPLPQGAPMVQGTAGSECRIALRDDGLRWYGSDALRSPMMAAAYGQPGPHAHVRPRKMCRIEVVGIRKLRCVVVVHRQSRPHSSHRNGEECSERGQNS
jgi:hypothetical protein